jgi:hypothetical protein
MSLVVWLVYTGIYCWKHSDKWTVKEGTWRDFGARVASLWCLLIIYLEKLENNSRLLLSHASNT